MVWEPDVWGLNEHWSARVSGWFQIRSGAGLASALADRQIPNLSGQTSHYIP
jgi:hypothetical protein